LHLHINRKLRDIGTSVFSLIYPSSPYCPLLFFIIFRFRCFLRHHHIWFGFVKSWVVLAVEPKKYQNLSTCVETATPLLQAWETISPGSKRGTFVQKLL